MRKILTILFCAMALIMTGCHNDVGDKELPSDIHNTISTVKYNGNKAIIDSLEVNDKGYYYLANNILYFYDISNDISLSMCSRTECGHNSQNCDAYARSEYTEDDFSWQCDGNELMLYKDSLYMVEHSKENGYYIVKYDTSYNNKEIIVQLSDFQNKSQILCANGSYAICNDYFYYCVKDYSEVAIKGDYIYKFHCMRVKLEKDAVPEELGEFNYPGDYVESAGSSAGISILCHSDNIYFFASNYNRMWVHENDAQCAVMRYNTKTSEFENLYSSTSGWDSGIGRIFGADDHTCIDNNGIIYSISDGVNIVAMDFENNKKEIIYTFAYKGQGDGITNLVYDGQYMYFIAARGSTKSMATYIKAIDTTGKEVASYEFKVNDKHRDKDGNVQTCGNLSISGLDNRNIVVLSRSQAYEGLSTDKKLTMYEMDNDIGVGLIPLSDFLAGKDITIKQIYKY